MHTNKHLSVTYIIIKVINLLDVHVSASLVAILREVSYKGGTYTYQWGLKDCMGYDSLLPPYPLIMYYRLWISLDAKPSAVETASLNSLKINRIVLAVFILYNNNNNNNNNNNRVHRSFQEHRLSMSPFHFCLSAAKNLSSFQLLPTSLITDILQLFLGLPLFLFPWGFQK